MKFGGTSVASLPRWQNIRELVASRRAEGARVLVVVSALSGITDALKQLCRHADRAERNEAAKAIVQRHYELLEHMQLALPGTLNERLGDLVRLADDSGSLGELVAPGDRGSGGERACGAAIGSGRAGCVDPCEGGSGEIGDPAGGGGRCRAAPWRRGLGALRTRLGHDAHGRWIRAASAARGCAKKKDKRRDARGKLSNHGCRAG